MNKIRTLSGACLLLLAAGCGGDDDEESSTGSLEPGSGEPADVDTGLPEDTPLESVTVEQYAAACETLRTDAAAELGPDQVVRAVCEVYAGAGVNDPTVCEAAAEACVGDFADDGVGPLGLTRESLDFTTFECGDASDLAGCTVTVGELETCVEDRLAYIAGLLAENDCDNAASVSLASATALLGQVNMSPASCTQLEQECPGVASFDTQ